MVKQNTAAVKEEKVPVEKKPVGITLQHIGRQREFTVSAASVLKIHRGTYSHSEHPRFKEDVIINPGSIVDVDKKTADFLLSSGDFQKYGV